MPGKISVVINTLNDDTTISRAVKSASWANEVVVCDMHSEDKTVEIAKKSGARVVDHERQKYVELARNFNISQSKNEWVLILDPDEEIPSTLAEKLTDLVQKDEVSYMEIPRKNIIFGKWMQDSMWWPDYNIRFFKKGSVRWGDEIHRPPKTEGKGLKLPDEEKYALNHYHYTSISQFIERMNRYSSAQAEELQKGGYKFHWPDLITKPLSEFLGRYFANSGFKDGLHGLALSLLQAFSFLTVYLKVWEMEKFTQQEVRLSEVKNVSQKAGQEIKYWFKYGDLSSNPVVNLAQRIRNKLL
ncbi:MAG: Glycosyl transferase, family 2 [Candidatus Daviesbacteria bacterium GW2011_GWA1_41_61]|uniref:Glycosyl transferase, family 2 n=1 Tax=Candidatus Daviesbacteria bacterium GW2011_GWA2_40_9 TaxID=1618424 RepID=A0A0G0U081_9BACT|nr:MAG: Glycosyl transferase, family 2 [Candidatus Daviesbacteria bacterium GW2011_GWA2_40_9]KKR93016.1 MAG: Glycosyl transferase, family 2 [Candidatus Daviesbacteria bacterium GW2011_GWB1_41_15]KKS15560.1 MAG: Glycosyl transferase, family 2 [Candidatus Daviesbacteria bacterium GW2011_GWA1_41_61]